MAETPASSQIAFEAKMTYIRAENAAATTINGRAIKKTSMIRFVMYPAVDQNPADIVSVWPQVPPQNIIPGNIDQFLNLSSTFLP